MNEKIQIFKKNCKLQRVNRVCRIQKKKFEINNEMGSFNSKLDTAEYKIFKLEEKSSAQRQKRKHTWHKRYMGHIHNVYHIILYMCIYVLYI